MKKPKRRGRPAPRNMPHCNPKWLRKQRRLELEGQGREYEMTARQEKRKADGLDEAEQKKAATVVAMLTSVAKHFFARAARLKGRMPRMARGRG